MKDKYKLKKEQLSSYCDIKDIDFETTRELKPLKGIIGQDRGVSALSFGLRMKRKGYNIYVSGLSGTGRSTFTYSIAKEFAKRQFVPDDWVYVYNFNKKESPKALSFKAGVGSEFKKELENLIESYRRIIPETFSGTQYENRKNDVFKIINQKKNDVLKRLNAKSQKFNFVYTPSEQGLISIPLKSDGKPMNEEEYNSLSIEDREAMMDKFEDLKAETVEEFNELRLLDDELTESLSNLDKNIVSETVQYDIRKLISKYGDNPTTAIYLNELENDILNNVSKFKSKGEQKNFSLFEMPSPDDENFFDRYKVNLFVDNSKLEYAPIINESNPIYNNIMGHIEYKSQMGVLTTDFTQIKAGSLHQANGGYIIFQMKEILNNPISWEMLKRSLKTNEINIENYNRLMGYTVTTTLKPEPIPLNVKVIIIGDDYTYNYLFNYDDDFRKLFKVMADFDVEMAKTKENIRLMGEFIATHVEDTGIKHFDKRSVSRVVEYSTRIAGHKNKLSTQFNQIIEILYEADLWAEDEGSEIVSERHVKKAIDEKVYRSNKYEEKLNEMFKEGTL